MKILKIIFTLLLVSSNIYSDDKVILHFNDGLLKINEKLYKPEDLNYDKLEKLLDRNKSYIIYYLPKDHIASQKLFDTFLGFNFEIKPLKEILPVIHDKKLNGVWINEDGVKISISENLIQYQIITDEKRERTIVESNIKFTVIKGKMHYLEGFWINKHYWKDKQGNILDYTLKQTDGDIPKSSFKIKIEKDKLTITNDDNTKTILKKIEK